MKILIAGDVHGQLGRLAYLQHKVQEQLPECTTCIQVGDFGYYPEFLDSFPMKFPMDTYAIDGNHENHVWLRKVLEMDHPKRWLERNNLRFVDRGDVLELGGATIGFVGGAMNVDRKNTGSTRLCYNNYVSNKDVKKALENFHKYQLDLMVTHSCPVDIGVNTPGHPYFQPFIKELICDPFNLPMVPLNDCGEHALTDLWNGLEHKPGTWVYGHFHKLHQGYVQGTEFVCVGSTDMSTDQDKVVPFIYDTETKTLSAIEDVPHFKRQSNGRPRKLT